MKKDLLGGSFVAFPGRTTWGPSHCVAPSGEGPDTKVLEPPRFIARLEWLNHAAPGLSSHPVLNLSVMGMTTLDYSIYRGKSVLMCIERYIDTHVHIQSTVFFP